MISNSDYQIVYHWRRLWRDVLKVSFWWGLFFVIIFLAFQFPLLFREHLGNDWAAIVFWVSAFEVLSKL
jgi:hypothetical protein